MARRKAQVNALPKNLDELVESFECHDMGEYWDRMPETHFEVTVQKKTHLIAIDEEIDQINAIAKSKKKSSESLVNSWLKEKI